MSPEDAHIVRLESLCERQHNMIVELMVKIKGMTDADKKHVNSVIDEYHEIVTQPDYEEDQP